MIIHGDGPRTPKIATRNARDIATAADAEDAKRWKR